MIVLAQLHLERALPQRRFEGALRLGYWTTWVLLEKGILVPVLAGRHVLIFLFGLILDPSPPRHICFYSEKKANSLVPAIFSPLHGLFRKRGGTGTGIRFCPAQIQVQA